METIEIVLCRCGHVEHPQVDRNYTTVERVMCHGRAPGPFQMLLCDCSGYTPVVRLRGSHGRLQKMTGRRKPVDDVNQLWLGIIIAEKRGCSIEWLVGCSICEGPVEPVPVLTGIGQWSRITCHDCADEFGLRALMESELAALRVFT